MEWFRRSRPVDLPLLTPWSESDARPSVGGPLQAEVNPEEARRRVRRNRVVVCGLGAVALALSVAALFAEQGVLDRLRLTRELRALHASVEAQRAEVETLQHAIERLRDDPVARERIARERLGMAHKDEVVFLLPDPAPARPPGP